MSVAPAQTPAHAKQESFDFDDTSPEDEDNDENENDGEGSRSTRSRPFLRRQSSTYTSSAQALSLKFMKSWTGICCQECGKDPFEKIKMQEKQQHQQQQQVEGDDEVVVETNASTNREGTGDSALLSSPASAFQNLQVLRQRRQTDTNATRSSSGNSSVSPLVWAPMRQGDLPLNDTLNKVSHSIEEIVGEYLCLCQFYKVPYNAGVILTLRFSLPSLRTSGSFHDLDMLALVELLLRHVNSRLSYITRLDFTMAIQGRQEASSRRTGFTSHGALALAKVLQISQNIQQVWLPRHRVGPYGASAIFLACQQNATIQQLNMRRCRIGERGALAFCELLLQGGASDGDITGGLTDVDLSTNGIGHIGTHAIEVALQGWNRKSTGIPLFVNLEGNLVFPEIMNGVTHGLGIILSCIGGYLMAEQVKDMTWTHAISCSVYTMSLLTLYVSSTLFHSFFPLQNIKYIFQVMDKCAIYVLIAGNYTPFLTIMFHDEPIFSRGLLCFIWLCCFMGISVEAFAPTWKWRPTFSLAMYLGMGWASIVCLPNSGDRLPQQCINLLILGGVSYTAGVPFFVRNNNLDHALWHLFVLGGSIFHWFGVYLYVAPTPLKPLL